MQQAGGAVLFIRLDVSEQEQERRLVAPSRTGGKLRDIALARALRSDFEAAMAEMPAPDMSIDTDLTSAADAAGRIVQRVRA